MRWWVFAIVAYVLLGIEVSLADLMAIESKFGPVQPRFVLLLAVFVGLAAAPRVVMIASLALGILVDLTTTWPLADGGALTLIGPCALGYVIGGYVLLQVRSMVFRQHPLTVGSMMLVAGVAIELIVVAVFTIRAWYEPVAGWSSTHELVLRSLSLFYSAVIGTMLAVPLCALTPVFGFPSLKQTGQRGRRW
ncbi:hypothetical protein HED60_24385 [Planctomycetales bacterium ZRK34]|nr:hypothetical protein HED60_24385 [Planctomycetales bacterium ZRK34]